MTEWYSIRSSSATADDPHHPPQVPPHPIVRADSGPFRLAVRAVRPFAVRQTAQELAADRLAAVYWQR